MHVALVYLRQFTSATYLRLPPPRESLESGSKRKYIYAYLRHLAEVDFAYLRQHYDGLWMVARVSFGVFFL